MKLLWRAFGVWVLYWWSAYVVVFEVDKLPLKLDEILSTQKMPRSWMVTRRDSFSALVFLLDVFSGVPLKRVYVTALSTRSVIGSSTCSAFAQKMIPEVFNEIEPEQTINPYEAVAYLQELNKGAPELAKRAAAQVSMSTPHKPRLRT